MGRLNVDNGESGLSVRNKINDNFTELYVNNDWTNLVKPNTSFVNYYGGPNSEVYSTRVGEIRISSNYYQSGDEPYTSEVPGIVMNGNNPGGVSNQACPSIDIYNHNNNLTNTASNATSFIRFRQASGGSSGPVIGSINRTNTGTGVAYVTTSDYRLKTNIEPLTGAVDRLLNIPVHRFNWVVDPDGEKVDGFLAHEAQVIVPESVTGIKDAEKTEEYEVTPAVRDGNGKIVTPAVMGTRTVPDYQGIDQSKLVPLLVAAVQELTARVAVLENK